jgi:subtilisin family serine protease
MYIFYRRRNDYNAKATTYTLGMGVAKNLIKKITNFSRKTATKAKDWGRYLMIGTALAAAPALVGCADSKNQQETDHPIEETGIWAEPYSGDVLQDENGNYYMAERLVMAFKDAATQEQVSELTDEFNGSVTGAIPQLNAFEVNVNDVDGAVLALRSHPDIRQVNRNYYFEAAWDNDDYATLGGHSNGGLWWSDEIELTNALNHLTDANTPLSPVTIAVIDLSFDVYNHDIPYYQHPERPDTFPGYDIGESDYDVHTPGDIFAHGTNVSSFAAAMNNGTRTNGVASIGDNVFSILPLKISGSLIDSLDVGFNSHVLGDDFRIAAALTYANEKSEEYNIQVVNMSVGATPLLPEWLSDWLIGTLHLQDNRTLVQDAIDKLTSNNIIVVASAGNDGTDACNNLPSAHTGVVSVGGTRLVGDVQKRYFSDDAGSSNHSTELDCLEITAPAQDLLVFDLNDDPSLSSGTSFAAPQVSGLVALIRSIIPDASFEEIVSLLRSNANDVDLSDDPNPEVRAQTWKSVNVNTTIRALMGSQIPSACRNFGYLSDYSLGELEFAFKETSGDKYQILDLQTNETREDPENCEIRQYLGNMVRCDFRIWNAEGTEYEIPDIHVVGGSMGTEVGMQNLTAWNSELYAEAPFEYLSYDLIRIDLTIGNHSVISDTGQNPHVYMGNLVYEEDGVVILDNGSRHEISEGRLPRIHGDYAVFRDGNSMMLADISSPEATLLSEISSQDDPVFTYDISGQMIIIGTRREVLVYDIASSSLSTFAEIGVSAVLIRGRAIVFQTTMEDVYLCRTQ